MLVLEQTSLNILCWCYASDDIYINQPISVIIRRKWEKKNISIVTSMSILVDIFRVMEMAVRKEKGGLINNFSNKIFLSKYKKAFINQDFSSSFAKIFCHIQRSFKLYISFHVHFQNPNPIIKFWLSNPSLHMATVLLTCVQMQCRFLIRKPKNWCSKIRLVYLEC